MLFHEAVQELMKGNYVTRDKYDTTGEYYALLPGMQFVWKIVCIPNPAAGNWMPLMDDFLAEDWKVATKTTQDIVTKAIEAAADA